MRLYSRAGAVALDDPDFGHYDADDQGGFDFPEDLSDRLHRFHAAGRPLWESEAEKHQRLIAEDRVRSQDPGVMLALMQRLVDATEGNTTDPQDPTPKSAAKRTARAKAAPTD